MELGDAYEVIMVVGAVLALVGLGTVLYWTGLGVMALIGVFV